MPCVTEIAAPATNRPRAANSDQTYASRPWPNGCCGSAGRCERRLAMSRKTSLPASAQECAASASSEAEPVMTAAADLASAMSRLAANATTTVTKLPDPSGPPPAAPPSRSVCGIGRVAGMWGA